MKRFVAGIVGLGLTLGGATAAETLRPLSDLATIDDPSARSLAIWAELAKVYTHARCTNCHSEQAVPRQADTSRPHIPRVVRGEGGFGTAALACKSCHGAENFDAGRVPGAPKWHMPPAVMAFTDRTPTEICTQIKTRETNGDRSLQVMVMHVAFDRLIQWSWAPGEGREPAPGTHQDFVALTNEWIATGAVCPAD